MKPRTTAHRSVDPHSHTIPVHSFLFVFPWDVWRKINKLLKHCEYELTKHCLERRLEGFKVSWCLKMMKLVEYRIAKKSYDFHHCCRWLHHHYSWGCHVRFWRLDSKSVISYCFLLKRSSYVQITFITVKSQSAWDVQSHSLHVKVLDFAPSVVRTWGNLSCHTVIQ